MDTQSNKRKTKILYVATKSNWGGAQRYIYDLATHLPKANFDIVVAFGGEDELKEKLEEKHIRTISIPRLGRDIYFFDEIRVFFSLLSLFLSENPNIIHLNSSKVGGIGSVAARIYNFLPKSNPLQAKSYKLKATIIFTVHGWAFNEDRPLWQRIAIRFVSWVTVVCSHAIIAVSEYNARQGRSMFFARDKIIVIHNGITTPNFLPREQAQAELLGARAKNVPKNALWMGAIAELTKNKGITYALMGIRHLVNDMELPRPIVYVVIGDGEGKVPLVNLINEFNLQNIVHLVGSKKDAATLLKALDIFLFPSIKEGLPYALLEAGEAGLPVITTPVGGIPEIIRDMETGLLIRPKEVLEIKKAIHFVLTHENTVNAFGPALKKYVRGNFSLEQMLEKTESVYRAEN
ncbi:MAG: glycosyltransferase [Patescibacteria group bacterium]